MSSSPDSCSCPPGACHGGHTIQIGGTTCDRDGCPAALPGVPPAERTAEHEEWAELAGWHLANKYMPTDRCPDHWPTDGEVEQQADRLADERLIQFRDDEYVCVTDEVRSMAAELLAARARITELEAERDRVTDLFESWAAEENEHRLANEFGIAEGLKVAIEGLREAVHGSEGQANG